MKSPYGARAVLLFACIVLLAATPVSAKEWSAAQKEVLNSFNTYLADVQRGNTKAMIAYWHPKYVSWNYAEELPTHYDSSLKGLEEFFANYKFTKFECDPLEIQVEGDIAILHVRFRIVISDSAGKEMSSSGPETVILVKRENKWSMIGLVWTEKNEGKTKK